jgi:hypothetical protein
MGFHPWQRIRYRLFELGRPSGHAQKIGKGPRLARDGLVGILFMKMMIVSRVGSGPRKVCAFSERAAFRSSPDK